MYGRFFGRSLLVNDKQKDGYKPLVYTQEPIATDGYRTVFSWVDAGDTIVQKWDVVAEASATYEASNTDYEAALNRLGVET